MPTRELTDRFSERRFCPQHAQSAKLKAGDDRAEFFDTIVKGLTIVVRPTGTGTFFLHYTDPRPSIDC